jgi:putative peptidoglycan lipid II flippase
VAVGTLASRILGLARDVVLAAVFSRAVTDAFFIAFTIPNALRQILGEGAISSAVVPVLTKKIEGGGDEAGRAFFAKARGASLSLLVVITGLGMICARPLSDLFAGGYHDRPEEFERVVGLTRTVFPYIFFMGTAALGMAALNAKRKFAVAAFVPGLLNVSFLICAFTLPAVLVSHGIDVGQTLAIGALAGGFLQVAAQWPALVGIGYAQRPVIDFKDPAVRDMGRRLLPMTFGIGVYYIDLVLSRRFLSELGEGAQTYFGFAQRLSEFPQGIFVMAISTAALPALATLAAKGEHDEMKKTFAYGLRLGLFVAIPASVALVILSEPVVRAMFQRGAFDAHATEQTARALMWQGGSLFTVAVVRQVVPVFHAMGDTRTPVIVSALDLIVFIVMAVSLKKPWGHVGVSAAVAGSSAAQMAMLLIALRMKIGQLYGASIVSSAARTLAASAVGALGGHAVVRLFGNTNAVVTGAVALAVFGGIFALCGWGLKSPELDAVVGAVGRRLRRA